MMMINKVILCGNIGRPPKVSRAQNGREMASFALATGTFCKTSPGDGGEQAKWKASTDWHTIMVFRESVVEWVKSTLKQGDTILVEGKLTYHQWTDKYGQKRFAPHVVISGAEGKVLHIRSSKVQPQHEDSQENTLVYEEEPSQEEGCLPFDPSEEISPEELSSEEVSPEEVSPEEVFPCPQNNADKNQKGTPIHEN